MSQDVAELGEECIHADLGWVGGRGKLSGLGEGEEVGLERWRGGGGKLGVGEDVNNFSRLCSNDGSKCGLEFGGEVEGGGGILRRRNGG